MGFTESDQRERVEQNRRRFFAQLGGKDFTPASAKQVHSSHSFVVTRDPACQSTYQLPGIEASVPPSTHPPAGDGLMTAEPGVLLNIRIADCLPVLLVDPRHRVVAAVHAGWRGALARIIEKAVGDMRRAFGSDPYELIAVLGPSIRACCFEVGAEVVEAFHGKFASAERFFQTLPNRPEAATDRHSIMFLSAYPPDTLPSTYLPHGSISSLWPRISSRPPALSPRISWWRTTAQHATPISSFRIATKAAARDGRSRRLASSNRAME